MRGTEVCDECGCDLNRLFSLLGKKWTLLIFHRIAQGSVSFNELKGYSHNRISPILLSRRIKEMLYFRIIDKVVVNGKPRYALSSKGRTIDTMLGDFRKWAKRNDIELPLRCLE